MAVADVRYANGTDPALMGSLRGQPWLASMAAFGGWNMVGHTIGTVVAKASALASATNRASRMAHDRFLLHRFVEDLGHQQWLCPRLRAWLAERTGRSEPEPSKVAMRTAGL